MLPPFFGNTIYEATVPLSVTLIMTQCEGLTEMEEGYRIWLEEFPPGMGRSLILIMKFS
jgi:hypothetical protein